MNILCLLLLGIVGNLTTTRERLVIDMTGSDSVTSWKFVACIYKKHPISSHTHHTIVVIKCRLCSLIMQC